MHLISRKLALIAGVIAMSCAFVPVGAQTFPTRSLRMIVPFAPGGGIDIVGRIVAQRLSDALGQPVVVDNRSAAGGTFGTNLTAKAAPDGHTLLTNSISMAVNATLYAKLPYDTIKDFSPVTLAHKSPNVLVLHPAVAVTSVKELIELARAKRGQINYSSSGSGLSVHLAAELFKSMAGVDIVRVLYRGSGPALIGLMGGETSLMFATPGSAAPLVKSGKLKALAVTSAQPSTLFPGLPTVASGLPGYESVSTNGVLAPARTPAAIVNRLNQEIVRVLLKPDVKEKFFIAGSEVIASTPHEFAATIKSEMAKWGKVIRDVNIRSE